MVNSNSSLKVEVSRLKHKLEEKERLIRIHRNKMIDLEKDRTQLTAANEKKEYDLENLRKASTLKREQINHLTKENRTLTEANEKLSNEKSEMSKTLESLKSEVAELKVCDYIYVYLFCMYLCCI